RLHYHVSECRVAVERSCQQNVEGAGRGVEVERETISHLPALVAGAAAHHECRVSGCGGLTLRVADGEFDAWSQHHGAGYDESAAADTRLGIVVAARRESDGEHGDSDGDSHKTLHHCAPAGARSLTAQLCVARRSHPIDQKTGRIGV